MRLNVPDTYLCTMCGEDLRMFGEGNTLEDMCAGCFGAWTRQQAVERLHEELMADVAVLLADGTNRDVRQFALGRVLRNVVEWPELVDALRDQLTLVLN